MFHLIFPFITRCTVLSFDKNLEEALDELGVRSALRKDVYYGLTGFHAAKNGLLATAAAGRVLVVFTIDRLFVTKGFRPQFLVGDLEEESKGRDQSLTFLILDGNKSLTGDHGIDKIF